MGPFKVSLPFDGQHVVQKVDLTVPLNWRSFLNTTQTLR